jgi:hypothetical protein
VAVARMHAVVPMASAPRCGNVIGTPPAIAASQRPSISD